MEDTEINWVFLFIFYIRNAFYIRSRFWNSLKYWEFVHTCGLSWLKALSVYLAKHVQKAKKTLV